MAGLGADAAEARLVDAERATPASSPKDVELELRPGTTVEWSWRVHTLPGEAPAFDTVRDLT